MAIEIIMIKHGAGLFPATDKDQSGLGKIKAGNPVKIEIKQQSDRSLQHHRLFYGGLIKLTLDYYQPTSSLVTERDRALVKFVIKSLGVESIGADKCNQVYAHVIDSLQKSRASKIYLQPMDTDAFVGWLKIQAGHYTSIRNPDGSITQKPKSINFNSMSQHEFNVFYKACFNVCWGLVLSANFESEDSCQAVINELSSMGG